ncbi:MAG: C2H2-type zinc finger protein, partial [Candidatus Endonucleobacter bathymodioli]|nr:C2H2-type zinc finger protein [Candidatus Endonucleobacter bathymodioli]
MLKIFLFEKLFLYRTKLLAFVKSCFFYLCFLISFCIKAGPQQQIEHDVFFEGMNLFTEPDRWIFKKLDQALVPENISGRDVLLIIDPGFLMSCQNAIMDLYQATDNNVCKNIEHYMTVYIRLMLGRKEVQQEFIDFIRSFVFNAEDAYLFKKIDVHLYPLLEIKVCDIYIDGSFGRNILKYAAVVVFSCNEVGVPVAKTMYNNSEADQNQKKLYLNKYDIPSDTRNGIYSVINDTNLTKEESDSKETAALCSLNESSRVRVEAGSEDTPGLISIKPKRKTYECKTCGRGGFYNLKEHIFSHTGDSDFKCSTCHKTFFSKFKLDAHVTAHEKVGAFVCDKCSKAFQYKGSLIAHKMRHTNGHAFRCNTCGATFGSTYHLSNHKRL